MRSAAALVLLLALTAPVYLAPVPVSAAVQGADASYPVQVAVSIDHSCAVLVDGAVKCWGVNQYGQLGDGTKRDSNTPVSVVGISTAIQVSVGGSTSCVLLESGSIECWGWNTMGQLGNGSNTDSVTPVSVVGIDTAIQVSADYNHACAVLVDGTVKCWGWNWGGELGDGTERGSNIPVSVLGVDTAIRVETSTTGGCVALAAGSVTCWGWGGWGYSEVPSPVEGFHDVVQVGGEARCALRTNGVVECRQGDDYGIAPKAGIGTVTQLAANFLHSCALVDDGTIRCWGGNGSGELGNGGPVPNNISDTPLLVVGIENAVQIDVDESNSCAVLSNGVIKCWGMNLNGALGDGTNSNSFVPVRVVGLASNPNPPGAEFSDLFSERPQLHQGHSSVLRLYWAVLDREPELGGARYWLDVYDCGDWGAPQISQFFATSPEFKNSYGDSLSNEEFVTVVYENVLGRDPEPDGYAYWVDQANTGLSRGELVLWVSASQEFINSHPLPSDAKPDTGPLG